MDIIEATRTTFEHGGLTFAELTVYDKAQLLLEHRRERREQLRRNLSDCNFSPEQTFAELENFDAAAMDEQTWVDYVCSVPGQARIISLSLDKAGGGEPSKLKDALGKAKPTMALLARIAGLTLKPVAEGGGGGGADPLPGAGEATAPSPQPTAARGLAYGQ